jgi:hypothetical protein
VTGPYSYTDPDGDRLEILPTAGGAIKLAAHDTSDDTRTNIVVLVADLDEFVTEMYRAAGLPAPLFLVRDEADDGWHRVTGTRGAA